MEPAIKALLKRLQDDYEEVATADNPIRAASQWAGRMREELSGPAWTTLSADGGRPEMSDTAQELLRVLDEVGRADFWRPQSLSEFRAAVLRL